MPNSSLQLIAFSLCVLTSATLAPLSARADTQIDLRGYTDGGKYAPAQPSAAAAPVDVRSQLQAAIDAVGAAGGGTVLVPGDTDSWFVSGPVFMDKAGVTLQGEGTTLICPIGLGNGDGECMPPVLAGMPRQVAGSEIGTGHREALAYDASRPAQTLDRSAGQRFGLRTKARNAAGTTDVFAHGYFTNTILAIGPLDPRYLGQFTTWQCPKDASGKPLINQYILTFDIAIKQNTAGTLSGTICGVGTSNSIESRFTNWMLGTFPSDANPSTIKFKFKTGAPDGTAVVHELALGSISDINVHRMSVQLDIGTGQCAAWFDGRQTSTLALGSVAGSYGTVIPDKQLWRFEQGAFQLGALHNGALGDVGPDGLNPAQQHFDWTYCGYQMCDTQRYAWDATQRRLDNQPIDDTYRYFEPAYTQGVSANLPLTGYPSGASAATNGTLVSVAEGQGRGDAIGFWLPERSPVRDSDGLFGLRNIAIRDMNLGGPLPVGETRNLYLNNVNPRGQDITTFDDQNCGVMNGDDLASVTDIDCSRYVYSSAYTVLSWANKALYSENFNCYPTDVTTVRLVGCHGTFRSLFLNADKGEYYMRSFTGARGGTLEILNPCIDNEGWPIPTKAAFYVEFSPLGHGVTRGTNKFIFRNTFTGTIPFSSPVIELPNIGEGTVQYENVATGPIGASFMKACILNRNPNAYGLVRIFLPISRVWSNQTFYGYRTAVGDVYLNKPDGFYYRATVAAIPGESYEKDPTTGAVVSDDNRPHADEAWKQYWQMATPPAAAWKLGASYSAGDVVLADVEVLQYVKLQRAFRATQSHVAGAANQPGVGENWKQDWFPLEWTLGKTYAAGDQVSADGALYRCLGANTASSGNRPRPWDKLANDPATWPFRVVEYDGPAGTTNKIMTAHYEIDPVTPPVTGAWDANSDVVNVHDPQPGQPTAYRDAAGGAPGTWVPVARLRPAGP